jgi:hypothetical protein
MQSTLKRELKGLETFVREAMISYDWLLFIQLYRLIKGEFIEQEYSCREFIFWLVYGVHLSGNHSTSV